MEYQEKLSLKHLAEDDRPREKLKTKGRHTLSDAELIAITIGSGTKQLTAIELAQQILASVHNNLNELGKLTVDDLCRFKGIGEAKAISIVAAVELGRRRQNSEPVQKPIIRSSSDAYQYLKPLLSDLVHEEFWILLLNRANRVVDSFRVSSGGLTATVVDNRILFKAAIDKLATGIILAHNHPSGQLKPSEQDILLTKKIQDSSRILDIQILDHLILGDNKYLSFADDGLL